MKKYFVTGLLVAVSFFTFSCEREPKMIWSDHVSLEYFVGRGFNLRFKEISVFTENIVTDYARRDVLTNVSLNLAGVLVVDNNDVITIGNIKNLDGNGFNQVLVNCNLIPMTFTIPFTTVWVNDYAGHIYKGSMQLGGEWWVDWNHPSIVNHPYDRPSDVIPTAAWKRDKFVVCEFEVLNGLFIMKLPAAYSIGIWEGNINPSLPLQGSEVERIVNNGVEGVDWSLFSRDGKTYVRIQNNLYERRFNTWIYAGIADTYLATAWIRNQTWIAFDILDWDDITELYANSYEKNGAIITVERRNIPFFSEKFGDKYDLETITTPTPYCKK